MKFAVLALSALVAGPVTAQTAPAPNAPTTVAPETVLSSVTADWNDDGGFDRAILVAGEDDGAADLLIYLSDGNAGMKPVAYAPTMVWAGSSWGTLPSLKLSDHNGLQVYSENSGIGRDRWEETLTLAWRGGQFVVAGVTYVDRDTLDPDAGGNCDINLLTGKGMKNGKAVNGAPVTIPVAKWTDDQLPAACQF